MKHLARTNQRVLFVYQDHDTTTAMVAAALRPDEHILEVRVATPEDEDVLVIEGRWK